MANADKVPFQRLPANVVPINYKISLKVDFVTFKFDGCEQVEVKVHEATDTIVLNSVNIDVKHAFFNNVEATSISYKEKEEQVVLKFAETFKVCTESSILKLEFTGSCNDDMKSFYRSTYKDEITKETKYLVATQFEATDARRAFPCWDEPAIKATFEIEYIAPKNLVYLSNMPEISREDYAGDANLVRVSFARSPIMSTYLVAFIIGEFDYVEDFDSNGVKIRVYTLPGKAERGRFALQVACKALPFYKDYFGIGYPLPKMDLIAIPDFASGAMENWGLVTYREITLLVDALQSSSRVKQYVALVVAHELAHQWFGNLVTMEWWTHLWLNEGFATWVEYLCVDFCFPEWDIWTQFASNEYARAMEADALLNSHAIEIEVGNPDEINEIFDAISYSKGAAVIRMLNNYLGKETFSKGLNIYLTRFQYANASTNDLWSCLEEASGLKVGLMMDTWTKQMGYPVLNITSGQNPHEIVITQSKFEFLRKDENTVDKTRWIIPINLVNIDAPGQSRKLLLEGESLVIKLNDGEPSFDSGSWLLNSGVVGYFRVNYPITWLNAVLKRKEKLKAADRLGIQDDLFSLARAGLMSTVDVLQITMDHLRFDSSYTVWSNIGASLTGLSHMLQDKCCHNGRYSYLLEAYELELFQEIFNKIGWSASGDQADQESHNDKLLRPLVLTRLGRCGHEEIVGEAKSRFADVHNVDADLKAAIYSTVLRHGGEAEFNKLLEIYKAADLQEEKVRVIGSLGSASDVKLIDKVLEFSCSEHVRLQDKISVIGTCTGGSAAARLVTLQFVKQNWPEIYKELNGKFLLGRLISMVFGKFANLEAADDIKNFFITNPSPCAVRTIEQTIEAVKINAAQLTRDGNAIITWLKTRYPAAASKVETNCAVNNCQ